METKGLHLCVPFLVMHKRPSIPLIVIVVILVLAGGYLVVNRDSVRTHNEVEGRVRQLILEYVSVPLVSSVPPAMVDGQFIIDDNKEWVLNIRPSNFSFVTEEGGSQNKGNVLVLLDGKAVGTTDNPMFTLGKLSGEHIVTLVLMNSQKQLYRYNALPVRKTLRGYFYSTGFVANDTEK